MCLWHKPRYAFGFDWFYMVVMSIQQIPFIVLARLFDFCVEWTQSNRNVVEYCRMLSQCTNMQHYWNRLASILLVDLAFRMAWNTLHTPIKLSQIPSCDFSHCSWTTRFLYGLYFPLRLRDCGSNYEVLHQRSKVSPRLEEQDWI